MAKPARGPKRPVVHLFPRDDGWTLVIGNAEQPGIEVREFPDLGLALDAATIDSKEVHVVVHEPGAAHAGS
jgi:hypothetical protein